MPYPRISTAIPRRKVAKYFADQSGAFEIAGGHVAANACGKPSHGGA